MMKEKDLIREEIWSKLSEQALHERTKKSELIKKEVFATEEYKKAKAVFCYVSTEYEVETWELIKESLTDKKEVTVPVITNYKNRNMIASKITNLTNLEKNKWGIYQPKKPSLNPVDKNLLDLILVPGLAFDKEGNRLGRGKGFFDKFLAEIKDIPVFGLAFSFQLFNSLPTSKFDIPVTRVITA